jgi:hypothetical protein
MEHQKDGLPVVDIAEVDIPLPEPGGVHVDAIRRLLGEAGTRELLLASENAQLRQAFAAQRLQIDSLKAKVRELEGAPAPAQPLAHVATEEPADRPVGYVSPYAANGAER